MAHLVLGAPGPVALRLIQQLLDDEEEQVITIGAADSLPRHEHLQVFSGDAADIDFGLRRNDIKALRERVSVISVAETIDHVQSAELTQVETSRPVRVAAEAAEFVRALGRSVPLRFLSSLRIFGRAPGLAGEQDFRIGQSFPDLAAEALAVAEQQVRNLDTPLSIVRIAPIVGSEAGTLFPGSELAKVVRFAARAPDDLEMACSDALVHVETVERAAQLLLLTLPHTPARVVHIIDDEPWSERRMMEWVLGRFDKRLVPPQSGNAALGTLLRGPIPRLKPVEMAFGRSEAVTQFGGLLQRDVGQLLERLVPLDGAWGA